MCCTICPHYKTDYLLFLIETKFSATIIIMCVCVCVCVCVCAYVRVCSNGQLEWHSWLQFCSIIPLGQLHKYLCLVSASLSLQKRMHIHTIFNREFHLVYLNYSLLSDCCGFESRSKFQPIPTLTHSVGFLGISTAVSDKPSNTPPATAVFVIPNSSCTFNPQTWQHLSYEVREVLLNKLR